jgi:hypothetical protein
MYNRYLPEGVAYTQIPEEEHHAPAPAPEQRRQGAPGKKRGILGDLLGQGEPWKALHLEELDRGDILLLLILLFLFLEGDNTELVITLGLLLLLGLGDDKQAQPT